MIFPFRSDILVRETVFPRLSGDHPLFETIAFLSTVAFLIVFVVLFQVDRAHRKADGDEHR